MSRGVILILIGTKFKVYIDCWEGEGIGRNRHISYGNIHVPRCARLDPMVMQQCSALHL